jgi:hypothetical protein
MKLGIPPPEAIERVRFNSERELFDQLVNDKLIGPVAEKLCKNNSEDARRRGLLTNALRVTERIIPSLAKIVEIAKQVTHLESRNVETYIYNDPNWTAPGLAV